jgi:putative salt-induced outer membrane protein YdiY
MMRTTIYVLALAALCTADCVWAQPAPPDPPHAEKPAVEAPTDDATTLNASLGGSMITGNTKTWQLVAGSNFLLVRNPHALSAALDFAFGQSNIPSDDDDGYVSTVKNLRAKLRYDFFLSDMDAVFAASAFRWDEFAGIDARVQGQVGYLRYFMRSKTHRFWGELGYDLTYDDFAPLPPDEVDGTEVVHSARLFAGYDNRLNEAVTYLGGIEALVNVEKPKDTRINVDNALRSSVADHLQLELKFSVQWDNVPVPGAEKLDTQTFISLIYALI